MTTEDAAGHATKLGDDPPSKYLGSLIGSINDAAKSAQTSALFLNFLGLYLAATAISISDIDLLKGATIQVSQLGGVNIPIIATFLLGPIVFLVLHAQLLLRYRMLVIAVRLFSGELKNLTAETDRTRCRELLANVDLVLMLAGRDDRSTNTLIYRLAVFIGVALIPVAVLLVVQISFLRHQSWEITLAQRAALIVDLAMIVSFYYWLWSSERESAPSVGQRLRVLTAYVVVPLVLIVANFAYLNVPAADSRTVRFYDYPENCRDQVWRQPLDLFVCPKLNWGCRYLDFSSRLLVSKASDDAVKTLRLGEGDLGNALASVIGISANNRNLRFANFNQSQSYRIDLSSSDLRGATFWNASLQGAKLAYADLRGTNLEFAYLQNSDLYSANLANLSEKTFELPDTDDTKELMASCPDFDRNSDPRGTSLSKASLADAKLQNAKLWNANLAAAQLEGANLQQAHLQRATLNHANLTIADLRKARVYKTSWFQAKLDLADISDVDYCITPEDETKLATELKGAPDRSARERIEEQAEEDRTQRFKNGGCDESDDLKESINTHSLDDNDDKFAMKLCKHYSSSNLATATSIANRIVDIMLSKLENSQPEANTATDRYAKVACCLGNPPPDNFKIHHDLEEKLATAAAIAGCPRP